MAPSLLLYPSLTYYIPTPPFDQVKHGLWLGIGSIRMLRSNGANGLSVSNGWASSYVIDARPPSAYCREAVFIFGADFNVTSIGW